MVCRIRHGLCLITTAMLSACDEQSQAEELIRSSIEAMNGLKSYQFEERGETNYSLAPPGEEGGKGFRGTGAFRAPDRLQREGEHKIVGLIECRGPTAYIRTSQRKIRNSVRSGPLTGVRTTRGPMNCCPSQPALGPLPMSTVVFRVDCLSSMFVLRYRPAL